jgi:hypothetical protein
MWRTFTLLAVVAGVASAQGTPYWIEYNGANGNFPEAEGWTRYASSPGDQRYFEDGALVLDGHEGTYDSYGWLRPGQLDPDPQEIFLARWRLCVSQIDPPYPLDPMVGVNSDVHTGLLFAFGYDRLQVEGEIVATFEPGVFHDYEVRSPDMLTYDLYIDNVLAHSGEFYATVGPSLVGWGDGEQFAGSLSRWAGFSFGVIPEPCSVWLVMAATLMRLKPRG